MKNTLIELAKEVDLIGETGYQVMCPLSEYLPKLAQLESRIISLDRERILQIFNRWMTNDGTVAEFIEAVRSYNAELLQANSGNAVDEFEKWYVEEVTGCNGEWIAKNENGEYYEKRTQEALKVWLASRGIK